MLGRHAMVGIADATSGVSLTRRLRITAGWLGRDREIPSVLRLSEVVLVTGTGSPVFAALLVEPRSVSLVEAGAVRQGP